MIFPLIVLLVLDVYCLFVTIESWYIYVYIYIYWWGKGSVVLTKCLSSFILEPTNRDMYTHQPSEINKHTQNSNHMSTSAIEHVNTVSVQEGYDSLIAFSQGYDGPMASPATMYDDMIAQHHGSWISTIPFVWYHYEQTHLLVLYLYIYDIILVSGFEYKFWCR